MELDINFEKTLDNQCEIQNRNGNGEESKSVRVESRTSVLVICKQVE